MLDRIATHILAFGGDSEVVWFEGNHADYDAGDHAHSQMTKFRARR